MSHTHFAVMKGSTAVAYYESEADAKAAAPTYDADPDDVVPATPSKKPSEEVTVKKTKPSG